MREYLDAFSNIISQKAVSRKDEDKALDIIRSAGFDPEYIGIYRNNSACALTESLAANFPSVKEIVGEDYFDKLALDYLQNYPCRQRSVVRYGENFLQTIKKFEKEHGLAYLADFCRLDRAWTNAFLAKDEEALSLDTLADMGARGENLEQIKLQIMANVQIIKLDWPIFDIWKKISNDEKWVKKIKIKPKQEYALIWRYEMEVNERKLSSLEFHFLDKIKNGETLGAAMNAAIANAGENITENELTKLLPNAVGADIFVKF